MRGQEAGGDLHSKTLRMQLAGAAAIAASALAGCQTNGKSIDAVEIANADREPVTMSHHDAKLFRAGMQVYLNSLFAITSALSTNDRAGVATGAKASGMSAVKDVSVSEALAMPPQFVLLAVDTHQRFDALAAAASSGATRSALLTQLSDIVGNCTACHAAYRVKEY